MKLYEWAQERGLASQEVAQALMDLKDLDKRPPVIQSLSAEDRALLELEFASRTPPIQPLPARENPRPRPPSKKREPPAERRISSRYAVSAAGLNTLEFEALDAADALGRYVTAKRLDSHKHQFTVIKLE